jgi:hypothetical protein
MVMRNKKYVIVIILIIAFVIYNLTFIEPKVYVTARITNVTDKDYELFVKYGKAPLKEKTRNNCRLINVKVKVVKPFLLLSNVEIQKDTLMEFLYFPSCRAQSIGSYYSESRQEYSQGVDIYLNGTSESGLKDIFKDYKIVVSWVDISNKHDNKIYYLKDYLK